MPDPLQPGASAFEARTPEQHFKAMVDQYGVPEDFARTVKELEGSQSHTVAGGGVLTSPKNARGWFQVLPATAAAYGLDANDPFQNIEAGVRNMKEALEKNGWDADKAFAYYHGGSNLALHGPLTQAYARKGGQLLRGRLSAQNNQPPPAQPGVPQLGLPMTEAAPFTLDQTKRAPQRPRRPGDINVPPRAPASSTSPTVPGATTAPWTTDTIKDVGLGVAKGLGQTAVNLGELVHQIPGVTRAVDALYGTPGLSHQAFTEAEAGLKATNTAQKVGKVGEQIAEVIVPGRAISKGATWAATKAAPYLAPAVGKTIATLAPRAVVEGTGAAGLARVQETDPKLAAGVAAGIPIAGTVARSVFASKLPDVARRAVEWGQERGVPIDLATTTANRFIKRFQTSMENTPLGGPVRAAVEWARGKRLTGIGDDLAEQIHPGAVTPAGAGRSGTAALDTKIGNLHAQANTAYDTARRIQASPQYTQVLPSGRFNVVTNAQGVAQRVPIMVTTQMPVDMRAVKQALRPVYEQMQRGMTIDEKRASHGLRALRQLLGGDDYRTLLDVEMDLGTLKQLADSGSELRNIGQGLAARGVRVLQDAIDTTARRDPALFSALQEGRKATFLKYATDKVRKAFEGTLEEPVRGFNKVMANEDVNIEFSKRLAQEIGQPEMRKLGRAFFGDLLQTATEEGGYQHMIKVANNWRDLGRETKQLLFSPQHIDDLDNFFRLGRMLAEHPNPSGSALTATALTSGGWIYYDWASGAPATLAGGALAYLMNSPTGVRLLTQGLTIPGGTAAAGAWASQLQQFLQGDDESQVGVKPPSPPAPPVPPGTANAGPPPSPGRLGGFEGAELR